MVHSRSAAVALMAISAALQVARAGSAPTSTGLSVSQNPSVFGAPVTLTAAITPSSATGKVTFYDGATILGIGAISAGNAALTTIFLPSGSRSLKAFYGGDGAFASSTSAARSQMVTVVPSSGFQAPFTSGAIPQQPSGMAAGDFNGDNKTDFVLFSYNETFVVLGNGDGTFSPGPTYNIPAIDINVGDFNGDGKSDMAVITNSDMTLFLGQGDGTFVSGAHYSIPADYTSILPGDFNGDGKTDLAVVPNYNQPVLTFLGNGDGTFAAPLSGPVGGSNGDAAVADFNLDGFADLALVYVAQGELRVYLGNGDGTFRSTPISYATIGNDTMALGDLNNDGKPDIVLASPSNSEVSATLRTLWNNGDGTFTTGPEYPLPFRLSAPGAIAVGDFNGDGKPDVIVGGYDRLSGGIAGVLLGNGDGTLGSLSTFRVPLKSPAPLVLGEFNGDGRTDLTFPGEAGVGQYILLGAPLPNEQSTTTTLVSSNNPSSPGQAVKLTATVTPSAATGTVSFRDGGSLLGIGTLNAGVANVSTLVIDSLGLHLLSATYNGDAAYTPSTSSTLTQTVIIPPGPPAPGLTQNFLFDPGAEAAGGTNQWFGGAYSMLAAHSGVRSFVATTSPTFITQGIFFNRFVTQAEINSGNLVADFSYWYLSTAAASGTTFQISLTFQDVYGFPLGQARSVIRAGQSIWTNDAGSFRIPSFTYVAVLALNIFHGQGTGFVDDALITVSHKPLTTNLLANPGGESSNLAPGWVPFPGSPLPAVVSGTSYFGAGSPNAAYAGSYVFYGGPKEDSYISQTVDLSLAAGITLAQIDAGAYMLNYSFWYAYRNTGPASAGRITLTYYDANRKSMGQSLSPSVTAASWTNQTGSFPLPPLTRYVVYTMDFNGPAGLLDTGVFDDNSLTIGTGSLN